MAVGLLWWRVLLYENNYIIDIMSIGAIIGPQNPYSLINHVHVITL